jgi:hypothetical protein
MSYRIVGDSDPKYLAATDILIGDMSDINYEFLVFNRPIILLANNWVRSEFPDIGIKCDIETLSDAIERSIAFPEEYAEKRLEWLARTHHKADGRSSERVLAKILECANAKTPTLVFIHGNNKVLKDTLQPLHREATARGLPCRFVDYVANGNESRDTIYISSHNELLNFAHGYKVHVDHGNKGPGVTDLEHKRQQWKNNNHWPNTNLFITEGEVSHQRTVKVLGAHSHKAVMVGFPRSDDYLRLNTSENRTSVCSSLRFDPGKTLVTYAPAGKYSHPFKQGASLSKGVLSHLKGLSRNADYNILVKLKYSSKWKYGRLLKAAWIRRKLKSFLRK